MAASLRRYARHVVLIGEAAPLIGDLLHAQGRDTPFAFANTLPEAVNQAAGVAQRGDTVMLVPGCASFDMFRGFEHRGQVFRDAVRQIALARKVSL
jgi:UDP-N-acetylmuramoylalanine--D-glutamate ligase